MRLTEIKELLKAEVITGDNRLDDEFEQVCGADLMSDVLAFATPGTIL